MGPRKAKQLAAFVSLLLAALLGAFGGARGHGQGPRRGNPSQERDSEPAETSPIPLFVHVLATRNDIVVDPLWVQTQVAWADQVFAPAGVHFEVIGYAPLAEEHGHLDSRDDRHALHQHLRAGVVNVFIVRGMRDVDDPFQRRRGVHWRLPANPDRHWLILCADRAPPTTLAHELGHYFGNRQHSLVPGNIMSYLHGDAPTFDARQLRRIREAVQSARQRRHLWRRNRLRSLAASPEGIPRLPWRRGPQP